MEANACFRGYVLYTGRTWTIMMAGLDRLTVAVRDRGGVPMLQAARRWTLVAVVVLVAVPLLVGSPAGAASARITRSDAEAVFKAATRGVDLDPDVRVRILPLEDSVFDGRHYCVEDWHVIMVTWVEGGDASFTRQEAESRLNSVMISLVLNGLPLATTRTKVVRYLHPEPPAVKAYAFSEGRIMAPTDLSVGSHTLAYTATFPGGSEGSQITFRIDAAGTGACL
jgi:hypothetical protein